MSSSPQTLRRILDSSALATIRARMDIQARLLFVVRQGLPEFLAEHCRYCVDKDDNLLIYMDSPAWGSQLRFYGPGLLNHVTQATGRRFRDLRVRSLLPTLPTEAARPPVRPPARSLGESVRVSADHVASADLREALLRLSRTLEKLGG